MAGFLFDIGAEQLQLGTTIWATDVIKARLILSSAGAPDPAALVMTGIGSTDPTAEITISDAVAPAKSLTRHRVEYTNTANKLTFPSVAVIGACDRVVLYRFVTNDADSIPLVCMEITEVTPTGVDVEITAPANNAWYYTQE